MGIHKIAKKIIIEELTERVHPEKVEDVIFWALKFYSENYQKNSWGKIIASSIANRIEEEEIKYQQKNN